MIRLIIASGSPSDRDLITGILRSVPEIEVVGLAVNGAMALAMIKRLHPDLALLDVRLPGDGYQTTRDIMIEAPTPVVMMSEETDADITAITTLAHRAGALTVTSKPGGRNAADFAAKSQQMLAAVRAMAQVKLVRRWPDRPPATAKPASMAPGKTPAVPARFGSPGPVPTNLEPPGRSMPRRRGPRIRLVAMAASTGGPTVLQQVSSELPGNYGLPILIVQHVMDGFAGNLADWLNDGCALKVKVAQHGEMLQAGVAYVAPDNIQLGVAPQNTISLESTTPMDSFRPSASYLFKSVARHFGSSAIGVILTGMGADGLTGLKDPHECGGEIIAQDEASSVVFGMPATAIAAGLTDIILPPSAIAARLVEHALPR